ncbi:MAG: phosphatase PAP2 family protein [Flavobacteriales bacterium]|nr:phosphatase PAP2 family protein [Flavobacteriales bacterium]
MIKQIKYIIYIISCSFSTLVTAQKDSLIFIDKKAKKCNHCKDGRHQNENPYTINLKNELPYFAAGLGLLGTGLIIRATNEKAPFIIGELDNLDANKINRFDRGAINNNSSSARTNSNIILYSGMALPLLFLNNHHTKKDFVPLFVMSTEVFAITSGLTLNAKFLFNRTRPLAYNSGFSDELRTDKTSRLSFFSGHTAQTAAFSIFMAKVITDYHPNMRTGYKIGIWSFALALPTATGFYRVKGGKHFNTDVITGFAVGATIGFLVPHLHKRKDKTSNLTMAPFNYNGATGLTLNWKL